MLLDLLQQSQQCRFALIKNKTGNETNKLIKIKIQIHKFSCHTQG